MHASSARLAAAVSGLRHEQLSRPSSAKDWSIAQVLSHLGSTAEISTTLVERGIAGDTTVPRREDMEPAWERWNTLTGPRATGPLDGGRRPPPAAARLAACR